MLTKDSVLSQSEPKYLMSIHESSVQIVDHIDVSNTPWVGEPEQFSAQALWGYVLDAIESGEGNSKSTPPFVSNTDATKPTLYRKSTIRGDRFSVADETNPRVPQTVLAVPVGTLANR